MTWLVHARTEADGLRMRERVRNELHDRAVVELEAGLDRLVSDGTTIHIPRLDISLGLQDSDTATESLAEIVRDRLGELILRMDGPASVPDEQFAGQESQTDVDLLIGYLETGTLPKGAGSPESATTRMWLSHTAQLRLPAILGAVAGAGAGSRLGMVIRLLQVLPVSTWPEVAPALADIPPELVREHMGRFSVQAGESVMGIVEDADGEPVSTAAALSDLAVLTGYLETGTLPWHLASLPTTEATEVLAATAHRELAEVMGTVAAGADPDRMLIRLQQVLPGTAPDARPETAPTRAATTDPSDPAGTAAHDVPIRTTLPTPDAARRWSDRAPEPFGLVVRHAGLILLHPYLPRYLEAGGVVDERGHIPSASLPRAAALLHLLATSEEPMDFELEFPAVLLGHGPGAEFPLAPAAISAADHLEATTLLEAVVGHWTALGSTSVEGLRSTFLQRPGLLAHEGQGWRLRMESLAFDVLLDLLPWGFATVKLPWMRKPVFTEWTAP